jgi:hypothetical protein
MGVNMLGYGEIQADQYSSSRLMNTFFTMLKLKNRHFHDSDFDVYYGGDESTPFLGAILRHKSHVYLALKEFLKKER